MRRYLKVGYRIRIEPDFKEVTSLEDTIVTGLDQIPAKTVMDVRCRDEANCMEAIKTYFANET